MSLKKLPLSVLVFFPCFAFGAQSLYCPQNSGYINIGDTVDQVIAACGQPLAKVASDAEAVQKVPVLQLIYYQAGAPQANVGTWRINTGNGNGADLQVNITNNKVSSIQLNGNDTNASSLCRGNIQIGDMVNAVYNACGQPSSVNKTYVNVPIPSDSKPEVWTYKPDQYSPAVSLTFVNGKLQSID